MSPRAIVVMILTCSAGCSSPPKGLDSPVPSERLNAIAKVARDKDTSAVPRLITFLNSDDPVVRLAASRTLELLTGQTLGYDHAAPEPQRQAAIARWVEWNNQQGTPPSLPVPHHPSNPGLPPARPESGGAGSLPGTADTVTGIRR